MRQFVSTLKTHDLSRFTRTRPCANMTQRFGFAPMGSGHNATTQALWVCCGSVVGKNEAKTITYTQATTAQRENGAYTCACTYARARAHEGIYFSVVPLWIYINPLKNKDKNPQQAHNKPTTLDTTALWAGTNPLIFNKKGGFAHG